MQTKLKISAILLSLLIALLPLTAMTANALTFELCIPAFGLYCENQDADIHGKVKYVIDENGNAVQYSEYTVNATDDLTLKVPFISNAYELPQTQITVNQKAVTSNICYGNTIQLFNESYDLENIYNTELDESITGTLYTLTPDNDSITVQLKTYDNQSFLYFLPYNRSTQSTVNSYSFTLDNAQPTITYEIFALNGDFEEFESNAEITKQTLSLKAYIDRNYNELKDYYSTNGSIEVEFFYSLANGLIESHSSCALLDLLVNSITKQRVNAYTFSIQSSSLPCVVAYSMPVEVQKNNSFNPATYKAAQSATGNYSVDYTIELNSALPYVIESSAKMTKQSEYTYTAQNVADDFYLVFSSSEKPESIYGNNDNDGFGIELYVFIAIAVCILIILSILIVLYYKRDKQ